MGSAGRGGFWRQNGGIGAAAGAKQRVLRTQSVGSAEAEKISSAAEKVAGEEKRREQRRFLLHLLAMLVDELGRDIDFAIKPS